VLSALEAWVERGVPPAKLIGKGTAANDPATPLTRPLCPYPQTARYRGRGDPNDAANFSCTMPAEVR
jgi:feruloyl esterase